MHNKKPLLLILIPAFLILTAVFFHFKIKPCLNPSLSFQAYSDMIFKNEAGTDTLSLHYTLASPEHFGITQSSPLLPVMNALDEKKRNARYENYLTGLSQYKSDRLDPNSSYTRDLLEKNIRHSLAGSQFFYLQEVLSPSGGAQTQFPILMAEYTFRSKKDIEDYLFLLSETPTYLDSFNKFEMQKSRRGYFMADYSLSKICSQCSQLFDSALLEADSHFLQETFEERLQKAAAQGLITQEETDLYRTEHTRLLTRKVAPAYEKLSSSLKQLASSGKNENGLAYFPNGKEYYQWLFTKNTGSDTAVSQAYEVLAADYYNHMKRLFDKLDAFRQNNTLNEWEFESFPLSEPTEILAHLQEQMQEDFPSAKDLASYVVPAVSIKNVNPSLEDYTAPAYYLTPPLDDVSENIIYVNQKNVPAGISLYTTLAHEGYPGHLYQTTYFQLYQQEQSLSPIRCLLNYSGYAEGWALYTEVLSFDYASRLFEKDAKGTSYQALYDIYREERLSQLSLLSLLDIGIHYYGFTPARVQEILGAHGVTTEEQARSTFEYIVEEPAVYPKYYWSYLMILKLKEKAKERWGSSYSDRRFHTFLLQSGPSDFENLEKRLLTAET